MSLNQSITENARVTADAAAAPDFKSIEVLKVQDNVITPIVQDSSIDEDLKLINAEINNDEGNLSTNRFVESKLEESKTQSEPELVIEQTDLTPEPNQREPETFQISTTQQKPRVHDDKSSEIAKVLETPQENTDSEIILANPGTIAKASSRAGISVQHMPQTMELEDDEQVRFDLSSRESQDKNLLNYSASFQTKDLMTQSQVASVLMKQEMRIFERQARQTEVKKMTIEQDFKTALKSVRQLLKQSLSELKTISEEELDVIRSTNEVP